MKQGHIHPGVLHSDRRMQLQYMAKNTNVQIKKGFLSTRTKK